MISGPIVVQVLEGEDAIKRNRLVMGATNPVDADPGTIRKDFAVNLQRNSVHGSDSPESAKREINLLFKKSEIVG
jgi:nucleoside-diphosphate kinase